MLANSILSKIRSVRVKSSLKATQFLISNPSQSVCLTSSQTSNSFICKSGLANWWKEISSVKKITLQPLERKKGSTNVAALLQEKRWLNLTFNKITKCPLQGSMEGRRAYVVKFTSNRQAAGNSWCVWYPDKHSSIHTQYIYAQYFEALQMCSKGSERNAQ